MNGTNSAARADRVAVAASAAEVARPQWATWRLTAAAGFSGPLIAAGFLDPRLHGLAWIAFVPLFWTLRQAATDRQAMLAAFAAGFLTNLLGFYWLVHTMNVFGGFSIPVAVFFYACLTAYSSGQFVLLALGVRRAGFALWGLAPPLLWVALEFIYPKLFPWRMAHTQVLLTPLLQIGDLGGPYPLSLAIVWVNAGIVLLAERPRRFAPLAAALALVAAIAVYGFVRQPQIEAAMREAKTLRVALVQGNVSIEHKRDATYFNVNVAQYRALSERVQDGVDVVIWPETVAQWWTPADAETLGPREDPFPGLRAHLIYGGPSFRFTGGSDPDTFNSAFLLAPGGRVQGRYDKHILMPFGEYLPGSKLLPFIKQISPHSGDFTAGEGITTFQLPNAVIGPLVCYEDIVTGIPRAMTQAGAQVLLNMLNDAWFGDSPGPHEHQALATFRTIENRRALLRASNSGVTSIIDPLGRVVGELGIFREDMLIGEVPLLSVQTVYTRFGDVFGWSLLAAALGLLFVYRRAA